MDHFIQLTTAIEDCLVADLAVVDSLQGDEYGMNSIEKRRSVPVERLQSSFHRTLSFRRHTRCRNCTAMYHRPTCTMRTRERARRIVSTRKLQFIGLERTNGMDERIEC